MVIVLSVVLSACGGDDGTGTVVGDETARLESGPDATQPPPDGDPGAALERRLEAIDTAVVRWRDAETIESAHALAEEAANLVVGPDGPGYGDRDGDGVVAGESGDGLLPGADGESPGLATALAANACMERDVLGGVWDDPGARWAEMLDAIDRWRPSRNTMPSLASHPMRVVGWATFTLATDDLDEAHGFAGHARIHSSLSRRAVDC